MVERGVVGVTITIDRVVKNSEVEIIFATWKNIM